MTSKRGPCAKQVVTAEIITQDGRIFYGENDCANPQSVCPRVTQNFAHGEGYHLCRDICGQTAHAEVNALRAVEASGNSAFGGLLFLYGHTRLCDGCTTAVTTAGIAEVAIIDNGG